MSLVMAISDTYAAGTRVFMRNQPRIFMTGGLVLSGLGTVTACAATYKNIDPICEKVKDRMEAAENSKKPGREKFKAIACFVGEIARTYAVPAALTALGYGGIIYANHLHEVRENILSESLVSLGAAYTAYRKRMEEKLGAEEEENIRLGATDVKETIETEKNGKKKKEEKIYKEVDQLTGLDASPFAKFFDASSRCFSDADDISARAEYNKDFLVRTEYECDQLLKRRGYLFLSEVYEKLDIPITKASLVAGWLYKGDITDDYVSFGIYDKSKWATRRFINGYEDVILLDFNCGSNISDYI